MGGSRNAQRELRRRHEEVKNIYSTGGAFAALTTTGRVVTWGDADGGDSSAVQGELKDQVVQKIYSNDNAFAALLGNGRVVTWGDAIWVGRSIARSIQVPPGRTIRDVIGNSIILDNWEALAINPSSSSLLNSPAYNRYIELRTYIRAFGGNARFRKKENNSARQNVLQSTAMTRNILSYLTEGLEIFRGIQPAEDPSSKKSTWNPNNQEVIDLTG